jgi:ribosomal protein S20
MKTQIRKVAGKFVEKMKAQIRKVAGKFVEKMKTQIFKFNKFFRKSSRL